MKSRSRQFDRCSIEVVHSVSWLYLNQSRSVGVIRSVGRLLSSQSHGDQSWGRSVYPNSCPPTLEPNGALPHVPPRGQLFWIKGVVVYHVESWLCHYILWSTIDQPFYHLWAVISAGRSGVTHHLWKVSRCQMLYREGEPTSCDLILVCRFSPRIEVSLDWSCARRWKRRGLIWCRCVEPSDRWWV